MDNLNLISAYKLNAVNFRMSAEIISQDFEKRGDQVFRNLRGIPFYYLVSHASELFLKAALLKRGVSQKDLRNQSIRHNLVGLLKKLEEEGVQISSNTKKTIDALSEQHSNHDLRYEVMVENGRYHYTPPVDEIYKMLDELLMKTRDQ